MRIADPDRRGSDASRVGANNLGAAAERSANKSAPPRRSLTFKECRIDGVRLPCFVSRRDSVGEQHLNRRTEPNRPVAVSPGRRPECSPECSPADRLHFGYTSAARPIATPRVSNSHVINRFAGRHPAGGAFGAQMRGSPGKTPPLPYGSEGHGRFPTGAMWEPPHTGTTRERRGLSIARTTARPERCGTASMGCRAGGPEARP